MDTPRRSAGPLLIAALAAPLLAAALLSLVRDEVHRSNAVLVLVLVVVAIGAGGSRVAGVAAAVSSMVWFDFFLTQPYLTFTIAQRDDVETAVLLTAVGVAVTEISLWGRRHQARASRREGYLNGVVGTAALVADGATPAPVVLDVIARQITEVLGVDRCVFEPGPPGARPRLLQDGSVVRDGRTVNVDRSGLPTDDVLEIPVRRGGIAVGRFVVTATSWVAWTTVEQRLVAVTLADQAAAAVVVERPSQAG
jgi:K+-sensing histidine kinase KdpD